MSEKRIMATPISAGITVKEMKPGDNSSQWFSFFITAGQRASLKLDSSSYSMKLYDSSYKIVALSLNTRAKQTAKSLHYNSNKTELFYLNVFGPFMPNAEKPSFTIELSYAPYNTVSCESNLSTGLSWIRSMNNPIDYPIAINFDRDYGFEYTGEVSGSLDISQLEAVGGKLEYFTIPDISFDINLDEEENHVLEGRVSNLDKPQNYVVVYADVTDRPYIQAVMKLKSNCSFTVKKKYMTEVSPVIYLYKGSYDHLDEDYHVPSGNDPKYVCQTGVEPAGARIVTNFKIDLGVTTDHRYTISNAYLYSDGRFRGKIGYEGFKSAELIRVKNGEVITSNEMNKTGLVRSYCIDNADTTGHPNNPRQSWVYDDALAVIAYCASGNEGDIIKARAILAGLEKLQLYPGELNFFYDVYSGSFYEYYILRSGAQSWVGCSIITYTETTGDRQFIPFAENIANLMLSRQDKEIGSVKGGPDVTWYSTEHNIDIYYFLRDLAKLTGNTRYGEAAQQVKFSLMTVHMNLETGTLNQGINDPALALDCSTWGGTFFNSIGETAVADHSYDYSMKFEVTDTMPLSFEQQTWNSLYTTNAKLTGFRTYLPGNGSYLDSPKTIWSEGTMGAIALGLRRGRDISTYLETMCEMQETDPKGGLVYMNRSYIPYPYEFHVWPSVAGTAWLYFTMVAPELLWTADDLVTGTLQVAELDNKFYAIPFMNSIKDTSGGQIRYSLDGRNWGLWEPAVMKELAADWVSNTFFYQFKLGTEISSIYAYGDFDGLLPGADRICRTAGLVYENDSSNYRFFKVKATGVKYLDGSTPSSVYFNINADNGGGVEKEFKATRIAGTNDWEAVVPRTDFNNALGKYWIWCGAEKSFQASGVERTKVHLESHDITKAAIIVVPDITGSRLACNGRKIWDPTANEITASFESSMKPFLYCDEEGESIYDVQAIQDNQGARNVYSKLYQSLLQEYGSNFDVKFFAYDWRLDGTKIAWQLDDYTKPYKHVHVVAHGLGGLVSTKYMSLESNLYKVLSLTAIGTPFTGTVQAPFVLQTGNMMDSMIESLSMRTHIRDLAANYLSAYQLLPTKRYADDYLYVLDGDMGENTNNFTYNQKMNLLASLPWGEGKEAMMEENSSFHDSLMQNGEHLANKYKDKVNYVAGYGYDTISGYAIESDKDAYEVYNGAILNYTKEGDGIVPLHSATNNDGKNKTFLVKANHTQLVSASGTIAYVKRIINNLRGNITRSSSPALRAAVKVDKRKFSVLVQKDANLEIRDIAGNLVTEENGILYLIRNGTKKEVGTSWAFDEKRTQYALDPDTTFKFKFSGSRVKAFLSVLDLESGLWVRSSHTVTDEPSTQTVIVEYEESGYIELTISPEGENFTTLCEGHDEILANGNYAVIDTNDGKLTTYGGLTIAEQKNGIWVPINGFTQSHVNNWTNGVSPTVWRTNYDTYRNRSAKAINKFASDNGLKFTQYQFDALMDFGWTNGNVINSKESDGTYTYDFVNIMLESGFLTNPTTSQIDKFESAFGNLVSMGGIRTSGIWARRMSQLSVFWGEADSNGNYIRKEYGNTKQTKIAADAWLTSRGLNPTAR